MKQRYHEIEVFQQCILGVVFIKVNTRVYNNCLITQNLERFFTYRTLFTVINKKSIQIFYSHVGWLYDELYTQAMWGCSNQFCSEHYRVLCMLLRVPLCCTPYFNSCTVMRSVFTIGSVSGIVGKLRSNSPI